jgi:hypothetical protein
MKPVDTRWRYRASDSGGETYEVEVTVIAVTDSSYKLRERREGHPDIEYYYEYGPETDSFTTISLYEVFTIGGERVTYRFSPPQKYLPADGYLKEGLAWRDDPITVSETTMRRRERDEREYEIPEMRYSIETVARVTTPVGEFKAATLVKSSADDRALEKSYINNIGTVRQTIYDDGSIVETWVLLDYSFPERN